MTENEFNTLFTNIIISISRKIEIEYRIKFDITLVLENYESRKKSFKRIFIDKNKRIDRHKIAAIIMELIMNHTTFEKNNQTHPDKLKRKVYYAKEILAFNVGINIVLSFINSGLNSIDMRLKAPSLKVYFKNGFLFPSCHNGQSFKINFFKVLNHSFNNDKYDVLQMAMTLFLIEQYTLKVKQLENSENLVTLT